MKLEYDRTIRTRTTTSYETTMHIDRIDWDGYDWMNPKLRSTWCLPANQHEGEIEKLKNNLRTCEQYASKEIYATSDGGIPRFGYKRVSGVGMVSQWPYWEPRPCVFVHGTLGGEWMDWMSITSVDVREAKA